MFVGLTVRPFISLQTSQRILVKFGTILKFIACINFGLNPSNLLSFKHFRIEVYRVSRNNLTKMK